jgi:hypothetical protein
METLRIRRTQATFLLLVTDKDTGRFTIEGPMTDDQSWVSEILRAQKAGRRLTCRGLDGDNDELAAAACRSEEIAGRTWWPPGSIICPEFEAPTSVKRPSSAEWAW